MIVEQQVGIKIKYMKYIIIFLIFSFSILSYGQTLQHVYNQSGINPTVHAHQRPLNFYDLQYFIMDVPDTISRSDGNIALFPGYYNQQSFRYTSDSTAESSYITVSTEGMYLSSVTNTTPYNQFAHGFTLNPYYIKFGNPNHSELTEVKIIAKLPVLTETTIDNIVTIDHDTLKVVHLTVPLSVQGFKTLITQK